MTSENPNPANLDATDGSPSAMSVGASSHRRVESSTSVKRKVTVPRGSPRGMPER